MSATDFLAKAQVALRAATSLLEGGDADGAASRAYYAMFHAARAALMSQGINVDSRRHATLIGTFSRHLVKDGPLPRALGRAINEAQELRHEADYEGQPLAMEDARRAVRSAEAFVAAIEGLVEPPPR